MQHQLDDNFHALFGNAYRGTELRMEQSSNSLFGLFGAGVGQALNGVTYTLIVHVVYDMDRLVNSEHNRSGPFHYVHPLKPFVIGSHRPTQIESRSEHAINYPGTNLIVRAEYVTHDLDKFIEELKGAARKVQDERFYEELDKALNDTDKKR